MGRVLSLSLPQFWSMSVLSLITVCLMSNDLTKAAVSVSWHLVPEYDERVWPIGQGARYLSCPERPWWKIPTPSATILEDSPCIQMNRGPLDANLALTKDSSKDVYLSESRQQQIRDTIRQSS